MDDFNLFALTRTNTTNTLEKIGNFFLTPSRIAWNGYTVSLVKIKDTPLIMHEAADANHEYRLNPFFKVLLGIVGAITFVPGSIFKGLSYLNEDVRKRHGVIKNSFSDGTLYENNLMGLEAQSEEELCKKLAELKPRVSLIGTGLEIRSNHDLNLEKECELYGKTITPMQMLFLHKLVPEGNITKTRGRAFDYFSEATHYKGNFTTHFDSQEIDISDI